MQEITRRVNLQDIWQAAYTAGVVLPKPVSVCRYWHRSLNPKKLIDVGFSALQVRPRGPGARPRPCLGARTATALFLWLAGALPAVAMLTSCPAPPPHPAPPHTPARSRA